MSNEKKKTSGPFLNKAIESMKDKAKELEKPADGEGTTPGANNSWTGNVYQYTFSL